MQISDISMTHVLTLELKQRASLIAILIVGCLSNAAANEPTLSVLTESTPFTLQRLPGQQGGEATTFVKQVLDGAKIGFKTDFVPWKRSYQYARLNKNVLIYPIARTAQREPDFIWVGKIIPISYYLFKLANRKDIQIESIDEARDYKIGAVNHHAHHEYLLNKGFKKFQLVNNSQQNLKKLLLGRIDLFPMSSGGLQPLCLQSNTNCKLLEPAIAIEDFSDGLYMALSKNTDPALVEKVRLSYQSLVQSPDYTTLFSQRISQASAIEKMLNPSSGSKP